MITISNYDRDRAAAYIEAYAETLAAAARNSAKAANRRRMALLLARKLPPTRRKNIRPQCPKIKAG